MPSAGFLIYAGVMPLIKTFLAIFIGYVLAKQGLFPPAAARGASQISMNVSLPLLIFANIVPAFTPQNVSAIGPLFLLAVVYQIIGFFLGIIIREICYVPRNFWQGIIVLTGLSNWGNLPNAVVTAVTQQAPFDPNIDPQLGVSYVAIFIVVYQLTFWVFGSAHSLSWDYAPDVPQGEEAELHVPWKQKPIGSLFYRYILKRPIPPTSSGEVEKQREDDPPSNEKGKQRDLESLAADPVAQMEHLANDPDYQLVRRTSRMSTISRHTVGPLPLPSTSAAPPTPILSRAASEHTVHEEEEEEEASNNSGVVPPIVRRVFAPLSAIVSPVTISLVISLPIALIQPLKALFIDVSSTGGPNWKGPDGRPPLAFAIDTSQFVGEMAIPLALILLGASFSRLTIPRPLSRLPIAAMTAVTMAKMVVLPVIGVLIVQGMVHGGLIDRDAKAEKFVAMFLSGTPAAVNQLIVSSLYSPDGNVDTLAVCSLHPVYILV
ncbi:auxin efflux carrier [Panus rudis PR-1116 ss-1]|nr:auxin efflux carrier [Panus rudis PR-1116 ss-1]